MSRRVSVLSAIAFVLAAAYAAPTLWWRFGRDQGLFESMGRGWVEGRLPYVAAWDQKPPGIHAVYGLGAALFGAAEWPIRLFEIGAVLLTGLVVARVAGRARDTREAPAISPGIAALFGAGFQFTCFCYWHTGQVEPWEALAVLGSAWMADRGLPRNLTKRATDVARDSGFCEGDSEAPGAPRVRPADVRGQEPGGGKPPAPGSTAHSLLAGALGGVALLFKLPAVLLLVPIAGALAWANRAAPRAALTSVALYGLGVAVALVVGVLPWLVTGTFGALWELVIAYNAVYAQHKAVHAIPLPMFASVYGWPWLGPVALLGLAAAWRVRRDAEVRAAWGGRLAYAGVLLLAALGTVAMQPNNYMYHWSVIVPFVALLGAVSANALLAGVEVGTAARRALVGAALSIVIGFVFAPRWEQHHTWNYRRYVVAWADVQMGRAAPDTLLEAFLARHMNGYRWADVEALSAAIRARKQAGDTLCARWFEPVFYTRTDTQCTSRFSTEHGWRDKDVPFKLDEWEAEHNAALAAHPPTFLVTRLKDTRDRALLAQRGYREFANAGRYVALERRDAAGAEK